jgi:hypothetical protein
VFRRIEITNNNTGDSKARKRGSTEKTCFLSRAFFFFSFFLPSPPGIIFSSRESNEIIIDCCPSRVILIANLILGRIAARYFQRIARISELSNRSLDVSGGQSSSTGRARIECHIGIAIGTESESALKVVAAPLLSLSLSLSLPADEGASREHRHRYVRRRTCANGDARSLSSAEFQVSSRATVGNGSSPRWLFACSSSRTLPLRDFRRGRADASSHRIALRPHRGDAPFINGRLTPPLPPSPFSPPPPPVS